MRKCGRYVLVSILLGLVFLCSQYGLVHYAKEMRISLNEDIIQICETSTPEDSIAQLKALRAMEHRIAMLEFFLVPCFHRSLEEDPEIKISNGKVKNYMEILKAGPEL